MPDTCKVLVATLIGSNFLRKRIESMFADSIGIDLCVIPPDYHCVCDMRDRIANSDFLFIDSMPEIYCPAHFCSVEGREGVPRQIPFLAFDEAEGKMVFDLETIVRQTGIRDFMHGTKSRGMMVFTPAPTEPAADQTAIDSLLKIRDKTEARLTNRQRSVAGRMIFQDLFSPLVEICNNGVSRHATDRCGSLLLAGRDGSSVLDGIRCVAPGELVPEPECKDAWLLEVHSHCACRGWPAGTDGRSGPEGCLHLQVFPYTSNGLEKSEAVLANLLMHGPARDGLAIAARPFDDLLDRFNFKTNSRIRMDSPAMIPYKIEVSMAGSLKDAHVLIYGECGSGKDVTADLVHFGAFGDGNRRIVRLDCAGIDPSLACSALFGHGKLGPNEVRTHGKGAIEQADNGTLVLDGIQCLPLEALAKLQRFLDDKEILRQGASRPAKCNVKVVAMTGDREFLNDARLVQSGFFLRFPFMVHVPPMRFRYPVGAYEKYFSVMWHTALAHIEAGTGKRFYPGDCSADPDAARLLDRLASLVRSNTAPLEDSIMDDDEARELYGRLPVEKRSMVHERFQHGKCLKECYARGWENSNFLGIENFILDWVTGYYSRVPQVVRVDESATTGRAAKAILEDASGKRPRLTAGRKPGIDFDKLFNVMDNAEMKAKSGKDLQEFLKTGFNVFGKKGALLNYLNRYRAQFKFENDQDRFAKVETMRSMLRKRGCYADYPR
jgi:hypothetical protein